jgi:fatty-acid peroxygenase
MPAKLPHVGDDLMLKLWREGYRALAAERTRHDDPDAFEGSLLGRRTAVVRGREGARVFYDTGRVRRRRAIPPPLSALLFGSGAVHGLDGGAHAERKAVFLELLAEDRIAPLAAAVAEDLRARAASWHGREVVVFDELAESYGGAVLSWAGIELPPGQARRWSRRLAAIVDGFGFAGTAYARGWAARVLADRWAARLVADARSGRRSAAPETALAVIAGAPLSARVAGVELLNILRPTVAVAWPGTFAALALAVHPHWRASLLGPEADRRRVAFGHEARRLYPFVPALAGRARCPLTVGSVDLREGDRIVLDVLGTDQDPQVWPDPEQFVPDRFVDAEPDPFSYVPQGGGDPATGHRCPGEPLTVRLLAETVGVLAGLDLEVVSRPGFDPTRMPTRPDRGLVVRVGPRAVGS